MPNAVVPGFSFLIPSHINVHSFTEGVFLIHGNYASGKTHLAGDACLYYHNLEKKFVFFNIKGEDGQTSAMRPEFANLDYQAFVDIPNYKAIEEAVKYSKELGAEIAVVDSLTRMYKLVEDHTTGGKQATEGWDQWKEVHYNFDMAMESMRHMAPIVLFLAPSDLGADQIVNKEKGVNEKEQLKATNRFIVPDLPGKLGSQVMGYCDLAGYLKADYSELNKTMQRRVCFTNPNKYKVRQKLPKEMLNDIIIPNGNGGWAKIINEIQKSYGTT